MERKREEEQEDKFFYIRGRVDLTVFPKKNSQPPKKINSSSTDLTPLVSLPKYVVDIKQLQKKHRALSKLLSPTIMCLSSGDLIKAILAICDIFDPSWEQRNIYESKLGMYQLRFNPNNSNDQLMVDARFLEECTGSYIQKKGKEKLEQRPAESMRVDYVLNRGIINATKSIQEKM